MNEASAKEIPKSETTTARHVKVTPEYEAAVTKYADEHKNQRFLNDSHSHANLLANLMIGRTSECDDILIYSKSLPLSCFGDALSNSKSKNIRIILDDASGGEQIKNLPQKDRISVRVLNTIDGAHFWVAGDSFRLEIDHDNAKAIANFNDPEAIEILRARFEKLWSSVA